MTRNSKLDHSRARISQLDRLAEDRRLSPEQQRVRRNLAASQRAALKLRVRALFHAHAFDRSG